MPKLGKAFSDNVTIFKRRKRDFDFNKFTGWGVRLTLLYFLLLFFSITLIVRLFHLTIVKGNENQRLSEGNRIRTFIIHAPRGIIYDRRGIPLLENIAGVRAENKCSDDKYCGKSFFTLEQWATHTKVNINYEMDYKREYLYPEETASVLGYLTEITDEELNNPYYQYQNYNLGDHIGRMGLEAILEKQLRGIDGKELIEVDANNNRIRTLGQVDAVPGSDIYLTLDIDIQKKAYFSMDGKTGAVVASKPRSGEILALVSTPSFDPNAIVAGMSSKDYAQLINDQELKLFNRAISGVYPPGSIFKLIVSVAGLESGKFTSVTSVTDTGIIRIGDFSFANWFFTQYGRTDGEVNILKAIARSNDVYFYKLGETTGISEISKWAKKFGLGQKTGIELSGEGEGLMPDAVWRKKVRGEDWYLGDTYHIAIGQGDLLTTPLQANMWTNVIASGGYLCKPTLIKSEPQQFLNINQSKPSCQKLDIKKDTIDTITEGMRRVCTKGNEGGYDGTGYAFFDFEIMKENLTADSGLGERKKIDVACKTGTAEFGDPQNQTHAWFTAFAPLPIARDDNYISGDPEIVVTVLVEKGGEGSVVAAPIAKQIFEEWFKR